MENTTPEIVKILLVNTGSTPISTEKMEFNAVEKDTIQKAILDGINRMGKQSHALIKYQGRLFVCDHKARKGPSDGYYKHEVKYHPFAGDLS